MAIICLPRLNLLPPFTDEFFEITILRNKLLWIGLDAAVMDTNIRAALRTTEILAENSLPGACERLRAENYDVAVLSIASLASNGEEALSALFAAAPYLPIIVHHRTGRIDDVIQMTRQGAFHVLLGDVDAEALAEAVGRALRQAQAFQRSAETAPWRRFLIGQSRSMLQICEIVQLVAAKRCTILIGGETGTGKEVIAKAIHAASNRASQSIVSVNCTALPATLIESELFGHAKGAFTGAITSRVGRFEQAHRGTLFLDEIGDLPLEAQAKILRVLQEQEFQRVGSSDTVRVDVRVIAASNVDLEQAVRDRRFREDLFYRLNVVPIHLPPLRERRDDIPLLLQHFLDKIRAAENAEPKQISAEAMDFLQQLPWPGNIRQLEHAVQMAFALSGDRRVLGPNDFIARRPISSDRPTTISMSNAPPLIQLPQGGLNFDEVVGSFELSLLNQALTASGGNKARAADLLKIKRTTLLAKMKTLAHAASGASQPEAQG